ncbi:MAG: MmcQ/YjbR family DNA-binding protein [Planctomycetes bacterium]|nr:MmcQ/YjbR family DNA-binding protein [Planctomycetota bacterium]
MTPARFRRLALALPEAVEGSHHGHPDFRAGGRVFASLHADGATGMVRVSPSEQARLCADHPDAFVPANGAWGRAGCTLVRLEAVAPPVAEEALLLAWQAAIAAPAARRRRPRPT